MGEQGPKGAEQSDEAMMFLEQHGLAEISELAIEAHGGVYSVREAMRDCPPFAKMLEGMAEGMADLDPQTKTSVMVLSVKSMAQQAPAEIPADAKKKF